jgi:cytoskeleton protein RodZ
VSGEGSEAPDLAPAPVAEPVPGAGARLRAAREAAGLGIDDVARQLKLAPRQVVALESDDFASLPGRTFIRGFTRNYARLLNLDSASLLAVQAADSSGERGALAPMTRTMGELPAAGPPRRSSSRWAIPLVLVAIVAIAAVYEFARPPAPTVRSMPERPDAATPVAPSTLSTPLPLPPSATPADAGPRTDVAPPAGAPTDGMAAQVAPASAAAPAPASEAPPPAPPGTLALVFKGTSWVEVRDATGIVLSMTGSNGATREIRVAAPGDLTIGNASSLVVSWRGKPLDLAPHTRQNVARVRLD